MTAVIIAIVVVLVVLLVIGLTLWGLGAGAARIRAGRGVPARAGDGPSVGRA